MEHVEKDLQSILDEVPPESLKSEIDELKKKYISLATNIESMNTTMASMAASLSSVTSSISGSLESMNSKLSDNHESFISRVDYKIERDFQQSLSKVPDRIKLDVGGKTFSVTKETLLSVPDSYFFGLLSHRFSKPLQDGTYFIDRNPAVFDRILDFLRTGKLNLIDLSDYEINLLKQDFEYFSIKFVGIQSLDITWDTIRKPSRCIFSNNNLTITKKSTVPSNKDSAGWSCGVLGSKAVDKYTVKIESIGVGTYGFNLGNFGYIMVGFSVANVWDAYGANYKNNGFFLSLIKGSLYGQGIFPNGIGKGGFGENYTTEFKAGDYLTVIREGNTIRFQKNKVDLGVCKSFKNIPDHPLFPALDITREGVVLTLIQDYDSIEFPKEEVEPLHPITLNTLSDDETGVYSWDENKAPAVKRR